MEKPSLARTGRSNQCYNPVSGARIVAGCICLNETRDKIVMILLSRNKSRWILPKGGVENDEAHDYALAAERETWEEAGVEGVISRKLPVVYDSRGSKAPVLHGEFDPAKGEIPKSEFHFFELMVGNLSVVWPESELRQRRWCTFTEAKHELGKAKRPELISVLEASSVLQGESDQNYMN